jgi:hypothetical protein
MASQAENEQISMVIQLLVYPHMGHVLLIGHQMQLRVIAHMRRNLLPYQTYGTQSARNDNKPRWLYVQ